MSYYVELMYMIKRTYNVKVKKKKNVINNKNHSCSSAIDKSQSSRKIVGKNHKIYKKKLPCCRLFPETRCIYIIYGTYNYAVFHKITKQMFSTIH